MRKKENQTSFFSTDVNVYMKYSNFFLWILCWLNSQFLSYIFTFCIPLHTFGVENLFRSSKPLTTSLFLNVCKIHHLIFFYHTLSVFLSPYIYACIHIRSHELNTCSLLIHRQPCNETSISPLRLRAKCFVLREGECQPKRNTKESRTSEFYSLLTMEKMYKRFSLSVYFDRIAHYRPVVLCKLFGSSIFSSSQCVHRAFTAHSFFVLFCFLRAFGAYSVYACIFCVVMLLWFLFEWTINISQPPFNTCICVWQTNILKLNCSRFVQC